MTPERFRQAEVIFRDACEQPAERRTAFLDAQCGGDVELREHVKSLLRHDQQPQVDLESPLGAAAGDFARALMTEPPRPERIGAYRILKQIGEGGFGVVYLAEQDNPRRTVALKVLRAAIASADAIKRFEYEAQILGRLQHPGIAQIFEAGVDIESGQRQAFLAMEYIRGRTLIEFAGAPGDGAAPLDVAQRLELMARVCDAVQHAHHAGVIHRDLKPENILVTHVGDASWTPSGSGNTRRPSASLVSASASGAGLRAQPKILDFGVARVLEPDDRLTLVHTGEGQLIGTLNYMSPEQVSAESNTVDSRSDVYTLGVLLYQLLTGRMPYDFPIRSLHEAIRVISEEQPRPVSVVNRSLRGDVDAIVAKALQKDRTRRYQSAADLAADIRRYLAGEPIVAKRDSALYLLRKRLHRYRITVAVAAAFLLLVVASTVLLAISYRQQGLLLTDAELARAAHQRARQRAEREAAAAEEARQGAERARVAEQSARERAEREMAKAGAINTFLQTMLASGDPTSLRSPDVSVREVVDDAARAVDGGELKSQPEIEAAVRRTVGAAYREMGLFEKARPHLESALKAMRAIPDTPPADLATALTSLGLLEYSTANYEAAEGHLREAETISRSTNNEAALADALNNLGIVLRAHRRDGEAEPLFHEAIELADRAAPGGELISITPRSNLANLLQARGDLDGAERLNREALALARRLRTDHPSLGNALNSLAGVVRQRGKTDEAEALYREALAVWKTGLGQRHEAVGVCMDNLATLLLEKGDLDGAEALCREALDLSKEQLGADHPTVANTLNNLAGILFHKGRLSESADLFAQAIDIDRRRLGPTHPKVATSTVNLAIVRRAGNHLAGAEQAFRDALEVQRVNATTPETDIATTLANIGDLRLQRADFAGAAEALAEALEIRQRRIPDDWRTFNTMWQLGAARAGLGQFEQAEPLLQRGCEELLKRDEADANRKRQAVEAIIQLYEKWGKPREAEEWRRRLE